MLETIITQDFFYYLGLLALTFTIDRTTVEGGGYLFNSSWGTNFFRQRIYGEVILNGTTNDQIMPRWGGSFSPWFFFTLLIFLWIWNSELTENVQFLMCFSSLQQAKSIIFSCWPATFHHIVLSDRSHTKIILIFHVILPRKTEMQTT